MRHREHLSVIRAVARNPRFPIATDGELRAAESAGLLVLVATPRAHWQITPAGDRYFDDPSPADEGEQF